MAVAGTGGVGEGVDVSASGDVVGAIVTEVKSKWHPRRFGWARERIGGG